MFAVIVTVIVLELRAPNQPEFSALWPLWPTALSYALSYFFIAIIWVNHHHLMRLLNHLTQALIWINLAHLFLASFLPFATAWIAHSELASPVALYAGLFVSADFAYNLFEHLVLRRIAVASRLASARDKGEETIRAGPCGLRDLGASFAPSTAPRLWPDLRRPDPAPGAGRRPFTSRWRRRQPVLNSRPERFHQQADQAAQVRRRPLQKLSRFHSCDTRRFGMTIEPEHRRLQPVPKCSGRPMPSNAPQRRYARTRRAVR